VCRTKYSISFLCGWLTQRAGGMKGLPMMLCFQLYYQYSFVTWLAISTWTPSGWFHGVSDRSISRSWYMFIASIWEPKNSLVTSFPCVEICVLGHFSFPRELAVSRLYCVLWSNDCKGKLYPARSPVLINVKSSCYFMVTIILLLCLYRICAEVAVFLVCSRAGYSKFYI